MLETRISDILEEGLTSFYDTPAILALAKLSRLAYANRETQAAVGLNHGYSQPFTFSKDGTQGFLLDHPTHTVLGFRGTEMEPEDILTDLQVKRVPFDPAGRVHLGFQEALTVRGLQDILFKEVISRVRGRNKKVYITGHSLGGALATLMATRLKTNGVRADALVTFGSPRVGDSDFASYFSALFSYEACIRVVNVNDPITRIPTRLMGYKHAGTPIMIDRGAPDAATGYRVGTSGWDVFLESPLSLISSAIHARNHKINAYIKALERF